MYLEICWVLRSNPSEPHQSHLVARFGTNPGLLRLEQVNQHRNINIQQLTSSQIDRYIERQIDREHECIFLRIRIQEAKILRIQRIRIGILSTAVFWNMIIVINIVFNLASFRFQSVWLQTSLHVPLSSRLYLIPVSKKSKG